MEPFSPFSSPSVAHPVVISLSLNLETKEKDMKFDRFDIFSVLPSQDTKVQTVETSWSSYINHPCVAQTLAWQFLAGLEVIGLCARAICSSSGGCRLQPLRCKIWLNEVQRKARTWLTGSNWRQVQLARFQVGKFLANAASELPRNTTRT